MSCDCYFGLPSWQVIFSGYYQFFILQYHVQLVISCMCFVVSDLSGHGLVVRLFCGVARCCRYLPSVARRVFPGTNLFCCLNGFVVC